MVLPRRKAVGAVVVCRGLFFLNFYFLHDIFSGKEKRL